MRMNVLGFTSVPPTPKEDLRAAQRRDEAAEARAWEWSAALADDLCVAD
jgi:hypothetical protein